jgi:hypothetical protein
MNGDIIQPADPHDVPMPVVEPVSHMEALERDDRVTICGSFADSKSG